MVHHHIFVNVYANVKVSYVRQQRVDGDCDVHVYVHHGAVCCVHVPVVCTSILHTVYVYISTCTCNTLSMYMYITCTCNTHVYVRVHVYSTCVARTCTSVVAEALRAQSVMIFLRHYC